MKDHALDTRPSLVRWFRTVIASPVMATDGDYFARLDRSSAALGTRSERLLMMLDHDRDADFVEAARAGSLSAFDALVDRYRAPIVRLAFQMTHDHDEANDIAQDAFLRAFSRLDSYHPDRPFARWLFVIARNAALDALRRRKRTAPLELDGEASDLGPEDVAVRNDEADRVHAALALLPEKHREALELYYLSGLRYREIAETLDIPIGTVKTHISRAKRRLRDNLALVETRIAA